MCNRVVKLTLVPDLCWVLRLQEAEVAIEPFDTIKLTLLDHFDSLPLKLSFENQFFWG